MAKLKGVIVDKETGEQIAAKVQVLASNGQFTHPGDAILKVGTGQPFFYADGEFDLEIGRGPTKIIVERGTEYVAADVDLDMPSNGSQEITIELERWTTLGSLGWHPGNTHIHYDEKETRPDERLSLDPRVEDLRMTAVSILKRRDLDYATNKYPPGMLTDFSTAHHYVQSGEESRHNREPWVSGYGHIMLLNIRNVVDPLSRGALVDSFAPDYPPLIYACDDAHRQDGLVIWCHNGQGMEAPVAAALGKLDAFNLFDPSWNDAEYDIYHRMLNAGFRLPASTGSDWFVCNANRVYASTGGEFEYETWLEALKSGRTFITNGPALFLDVDGRGPGADIEVRGGGKVSASVTWESVNYPIQRIEIIANGQTVKSETFGDGSSSGRMEAEVDVDADGWIAARASSHQRDSYAQPIFAHTSPVYLVAGRKGDHTVQAARYFERHIDESLEWVRTRGRYYNDQQHNEISDLFNEGREVYRKLQS